MLSKRFILSFIAVFVTFSLYGYLVWGVLLGETVHADMGNVFRPEPMMAWIFIAYALMAYVMVRIWKHGQEDKGLSEGFRYGLLTGVLFASAELIAYAVQPIIMKGALMAFGIDVVMFIIAGMVLAFVYKAVGTK